MSLDASSLIVPANPATSSGLTRPDASISETPYMDVSGVLSSWETLDVNSLLNVSPLSFSVTSMMIMIAPVTSSLSLAGFAIISYTEFPSSRYVVAFLPDSASLTAFLKGSLLLSFSTEPSVLPPELLSIWAALLLYVRISASLSIMMSPSLMFSVIMLNSSLLLRRFSICPFILMFC